MWSIHLVTFWPEQIINLSSFKEQEMKERKRVLPFALFCYSQNLFFTTRLPPHLGHQHVRPLP